MIAVLKRMLLCVTLLGSLLVPAQALAEPRDNGSVGHLATGPGEEREKNSYVLSLRLVYTKINNLLYGTQLAIRDEAILNFSREDSLEAFRKFLLDKPYKETSYGLAIADGEEAQREQIVQIFVMLRELGQDFYPSMFQLVTILKSGEYAKRLYTFLENIKYLNETWVDQFKRFDRALFEFGSALQRIERNNVTNVTAEEIFTVSKLNYFVWRDFKIKALFDRQLRSLDNHIYAVRDDVLKKLQDDVATLMRYHDIASKKLAQTKEHLAGYSFYAKVEPIIKNFERILDQIKEIEIAANSCLNDAYSTTKIVGRLRHMKDFDPFGSLHVGGASVSQGCPGYYQRIQNALEKEKNHYIKFIERMNRKHERTPGYQPFSLP